MSVRSLILAGALAAGLAAAAAANPPAAPESAPPAAPAPDPAAAVLQRFFTATGGPAGLAQVGGIACRAHIDLIEYDYHLQLGRDGRFRIEEPDRITGRDGGEIWQSFHGLVGPAPAAGVLDYTRAGLTDLFFQGLIGPGGVPVALVFAGSEERRGRRYEMLSGAATPAGARRTYYFSAETGLLEKIVELAPDPDLRELKNVYDLGAYQAVGPLKLPSRIEGHCLTSGRIILPPVQFSEFAVRPDFPAGTFARPASSAAAAVFADGGLKALILDVSGRGSLVTNVTRADLERLGAREGDLLVAELKGKTTRHRWLADEQLGSDVQSGDYLALFNGTPALWLVKAFVGMTSDQPAAAGDALILRRQAAPAEEGNAHD